MATVITAGNATNGLSFTADNTGAFQFKTGTGAGTTAITVDSSQNTTFAAGVSGTTGSFSGNMSFNSGYGSSAVAYGCRAWVNFNAVGTVTIRSSGNVTSVSDNGVGLFTINFTNAMPDINYSAVGSTRRNGTSGGAGENNSNCGVTFRGLSTYSTAFTTTALQVSTGTITNEGLTDFDYVAVQVFR